MQLHDGIDGECTGCVHGDPDSDSDGDGHSDPGANINVHADRDADPDADPDADAERDGDPVLHGVGTGHAQRSRSFERGDLDGEPASSGCDDRFIG